MNRRTPPVVAARVFLVGLFVMTVAITPVSAAEATHLTNSHTATSSQRALITASSTLKETSTPNSTIHVQLTITHPSRHVLLITRHVEFPSTVDSASAQTIASPWLATNPMGITANVTNVTNGHLSSSHTQVTWSGNGPLTTHTRLHIPTFVLGQNPPAIITPHGVLIRPSLTRRGWNYHVDRGTVHFKWDYQAPANKSVTDSGGSIYIGPYQGYSTSSTNSRISLVVTEGGAKTMTPSPASVLSAYRRESQLLTNGHRPKNLTVYVIPAGNNSGVTGGTEKRNEIVIYGYQKLNTTRNDVWQPLYNTWLHEYVHSRQVPWNYGPQMQWYIEADANYYSAVVAYNEHLGSFRSLWYTLNYSIGPRAPLANQSTWPNQDYEYHRGPPVLALLDAQIRSHTNGSASFLNVMRAVNQKSSNGTTVTLSVFEHILEQYLPAQLVHQDVRRYITGTQSVPVPTRPADYVLPPVKINTSQPAPSPPPGTGPLTTQQSATATSTVLTSNTTASNQQYPSSTSSTYAPATPPSLQSSVKTQLTRYAPLIGFALVVLFGWVIVLVRE